MKFKFPVFAFGCLLMAPLFAEGADIKFSSNRTAFYRDESPTIGVAVEGDIPEKAALEVRVGDYRLYEGSATADPAAVKLPAQAFRSGNHTLTVRVFDAQGGEVAIKSLRLQLGKRPSPDALRNWLWMNGGPVDAEFYQEHGFDYVGGPMLPHSLSEGMAKEFQGLGRIFNEHLAQGRLLSVVPNGGLWKREFTHFPAEGEDVDYVNAAREGERYYNPFSPIVAAKQDEANRMFMEAIKDYPNVTMAWTDMEIQDDITKANLNREGREKMAKELGFTEEEVGEPNYVAKGVIADNDRRYRLTKYIFQGGNGVHAGLKRMVDMVKKYRPDMLTMTDPYRHVALFDVYPSVDIIHSWTYTNPDPKAMLYIEQLRAATKPRNQIPLQIVTLLNYPGMLDVPSKRPDFKGKVTREEEWMGMGPDRVKETTWINLSRAPKIMGYFYGSEIDPVKYRDQTHRVPPGMSDSIKEMAEKVFRPYGKMIKKLDVSPRKMAVLTSQAAATYNKSPNDQHGSYAGYRTLAFQEIMEMAHTNADVVFDEGIEQGALDNYDALFLPRADVLTETVTNKIREFQKRGGVVYADQYLGPELEDVHKFDFDFSYLTKVNARANVMGETLSEWTDHAEKEGQKPDLQSVVGVPAHIDQEIKEGYAKTFKEVVGKKFPATVDSDSPTVLFNLTEKNGAKYLFVINDKRTYDERTGKFKGIMEKLVPQTVTVRYRDPSGAPLVAYDMLKRKKLPLKRKGDVVNFPVELDALGGTMIAFTPSPFAKLEVAPPSEARLGEPAKVAVTLRNAKGQSPQGLQPVRVDIVDAKGKTHEDSDWIVLEDGVGELTFHPAWNDPAGDWKVRVTDLTAGLTAELTAEAPLSLGPLKK